MKKSRFYYSTPEFKAQVLLTQENGENVIYPLPGKLESLPRITICGLLDTETNILSFGAAVCSANDQFEKRIGRELSEKRALEKPLLKVSVTKANISKMFMESAIFLQNQISLMKNLKLEGNL